MKSYIHNEKQYSLVNLAFILVKYWKQHNYENTLAVKVVLQ